MDNEYISERDVANYLTVPLKTVRHWRYTNRFVTEYKLPNGRILFRTADIRRWLTSHRI